MKLILDRKQILYLMIFFILFIPPYFIKLSHVYYLSCLIASCMILIEVMALTFRKKIKGLWPVVLVACIYFSIVLATILTKGNYQRFILMGFNAICASLLIFSLFSSDKKYMSALNALILLFEVYVVINVVLIILFPDGLYRISSYTDSYSNPAYLLGHRNNAIEYFLPLTGLVGLQDQLKGRKFSKNFYFVIMISMISALLTWSVNEMLCMAFVIFGLISYKWKIGRFYSVKFLGTASAFASVFLFNIGLNPFFLYFIVNVFHKTPTMSGRTRIWKNGINSILQSPIFGYGVHDSQFNYLKLSVISSCHNYFLDFLYLGGMICLILLILFLFKMNRFHSKQSKDIRAFTAVFYGAYFILWIATPIHKETMSIMFCYFIVSMVLSKKISQMRAREN